MTGAPAPDRIFYEVPDTVPIQQGDIIRADHLEAEEGAKWSVVVTADCDIAQRKMGRFYTCLEIVRASDYVAYYWAADELEKLGRKFEALAIDLIFSADSARDSRVARLTSSDLLDWLDADGPEVIASTLQMTGKTAGECIRALQIVGLVHEPEKSPLEKLKAIWTLLKKSQKDTEGTLKAALKASQMRSDYVLIPALPAEKDVGFVVLLRSIRSVHPDAIYTSRLAYRIAGPSEGYFRLGRLEDFLRYSIAQKWASLYSRIGMTDHFESECETAAELVYSQL